MKLTPHEWNVVYLKCASDNFPRTLPQCWEYHYRHFCWQFNYFLLLFSAFTITITTAVRHYSGGYRPQCAGCLSYRLRLKLTFWGLPQCRVCGLNGLLICLTLWHLHSPCLCVPLTVRWSLRVLPGIPPSSFSIHLYLYSCLVTAANAFVASVGSLFSGRFHRPYKGLPLRRNYLRSVVFYGLNSVLVCNFLHRKHVFMHLSSFPAGSALAAIFVLSMVDLIPDWVTVSFCFCNFLSYFSLVLFSCFPCFICT